MNNTLKRYLALVTLSEEQLDRSAILRDGIFISGQNFKCVNDVTFLINSITLSVNAKINFKKSIAIIKISFSVVQRTL